MSTPISLFPVCSYPEGRDVTVQVQATVDTACWKLKVVKVDLVEKNIFVLFRPMMLEEFGKWLCISTGTCKEKIEVKLPNDLKTSDLKVHGYFLERKFDEKEKSLFGCVYTKPKPEIIDDEENNDTIIINDEAEYDNALKIIQEKGY